MIILRKYNVLLQRDQNELGDNRARGAQVVPATAAYRLRVPHDTRLSLVE